MTLSVHVTSQTALDELSHDAQVLRSVLGELRSAEGRSVVEELISGMRADGVVLARVDDVVTPREAGELLGVSGVTDESQSIAMRIHGWTQRPLTDGRETLGSA